MTELVFEVQEDPDGALTARAVGASIFTEADTVEALRENIREAVSCHFGNRAKDCPPELRA